MCIDLGAAFVPDLHDHPLLFSLLFHACTELHYALLYD